MYFTRFITIGKSLIDLQDNINKQSKYKIMETPISYFDNRQISTESDMLRKSHQKGKIILITTNNTWFYNAGYPDAREENHKYIILQVMKMDKSTVFIEYVNKEDYAD